MTRKFKSGDRVKTKPNTCESYFDCVGTVVDYLAYDIILVKFDNFTSGHAGASYYRSKGIKHDLKNRQHLFLLEKELCLLEGEAIIPKYLYHATYKPFLESIKEKGLGNTERTMWSDSVRGVVYLADDADVAYSYAENSEWLEDIEAYDEYVNNIIILKINSDKLDRTKLKKDANVIDDDSTFEYHGIIPFDFIEEIIVNAEHKGE